SHGRVHDSSCAHTTMSIGMDNTTKTINQPLVRKRSKTTLGEVVGKSWYFVKTTNSQTNTHCQREATEIHVGPSTLGIQRRTTSETCPTMLTQLRSNTNKSPKPYRYFCSTLYVCM